MASKKDFFNIISIISLLLLYSCLNYGAVSNSCTDAYIVKDTKALNWAYYFSENLPSANYTQDTSQGLPLSFTFKGGVKSGSARVSFRKSNFFINQNERSIYTVDSLNLESETFQEVQKIIDTVYKIYENRKIVSNSTIAEMRRIDENLKQENLNYVVFFEPITNEPKVVIRIFDGSPKNDFHQSPERKAEKLPIEKEYPHLQLPDRATGNDYLIELGRLGKDDSVKGDLQALLRTVAEYLHQTYWSHWISNKLAKENQKLEPEPVIYVEALAPAARLYKNKYHFEQIFGPKELGIPSGQPARYVLRISARDFIRLHQNHFDLFKMP